MKYYLLSGCLILSAVLTILLMPVFFKKTDQVLISLDIPPNNSNVAGIQKINLPPIDKNIQPPELSARSIFIKDLTTDAILYQKDPNRSVPMASTTKVMTALVASEYFKPGSSLIVRDGAKADGARVGLSAGEDLSFRSLLYGMLLSSGNDAAYTIAENYPGGVAGFVTAMNNKAKGLQLWATRFDNPAGFDSPNHFSSASDLAIITQEALKDPQLARIFATKETSIVSLDKKYTHQLYNLNKLLTQVSGVLGVKTGFTEAAKENLVTLVERDNHKVLIVLLGSDDRFGESTKLIDWVYGNFQWP